MGQGSLLSASATMNLSDEKISVSQYFKIDVPDSVSNIRLRALDLENTTISLKTITSEGKALLFTEENIKGLYVFKIATAENDVYENIELNYDVAYSGNSLSIPLFFTDMPAASSDINFFETTLFIPENQEYKFHFPKVSTKTDNLASQKKVTYNLPALPSMIKLELYGSEKRSASFLSVVDALTLLIFIGIGILIWVKRKHLKYG